MKTQPAPPASQTARRGRDRHGQPGAGAAGPRWPFLDARRPRARACALAPASLTQVAFVCVAVPRSRARRFSEVSLFQRIPQPGASGTRCRQVCSPPRPPQAVAAASCGVPGLRAEPPAPGGGDAGAQPLGSWWREAPHSPSCSLQAAAGPLSGPRTTPRCVGDGSGERGRNGTRPPSVRAPGRWVACTPGGPPGARSCCRQAPAAIQCLFGVDAPQLPRPPPCPGPRGWKTDSRL